MSQSLIKSQVQQATPIQQLQQPPVIQIDAFQAFLGVVAIFVGAGVAWGALKTNVSSIQRILHDEIKPDLKNIRERFMVVEDRVDNLWKDKVAPAHSPRKLNDYGNKILNQSGIKEIIEEKKALLLTKVKEKKTTNPYDAEQAILNVVEHLQVHCPDVIDRLKNGAFKTGASVETVLLVGGIHLRDLIFPELDFSVDDIDKHVNKST